MIPGLADQHERAQVLRPGAAADRIRIGRAAAPAVLAPLVDYLWWVEWNTPEPYAQDVAPRPVVHLAAELHDGEARLLVYGVPSGRFERKLSGVGRTIAVAFRPGGFRPFVTVDVATLTNHVVPVDRLVGADDREVAANLLEPTTAPAQAARLLSDWLVALDHVSDPIAEEVASLVERVEVDPTIRRAEHLAALAGVTPFERCNAGSVATSESVPCGSFGATGSSMSSSTSTTATTWIGPPSLTTWATPTSPT